MAGDRPPTARAAALRLTRWPPVAYPQPWDQVGVASPPVDIRKIELERTEAIGLPVAAIAAQCRKARTPPEQQQIEVSGVACTQQHTQAVNRQGQQESQQVPRQQERFHDEDE